MNRKPFRSRWSRDANILARVVTGVLPTPDGLLERQQAQERDVLEAFEQGTATPRHFQVIADVLNVAETMAYAGIGRDEVLPVCETSQELLLAAKERHDQTGKLTVSDMGAKVLRDLVEYHHLQRTAVDWQTYAKMVERTGQLIRSAHPRHKELV